MSAHTPGKWAVNPGAAQVDAMPSLVPVCQLLWPTDERTEAETEANARLIAAAPELLEALKRALPTVEHMYHTTPDPDGSLWRDVLAARAAIAKATGAES